MKLLDETARIPYRAEFLPGERWLVLAPHPDDESFGCGATLALGRRRGIEIEVVIVTDGAAQGDPTIRAAEAHAACREIGVSPPRLWGFHDRNLSAAGTVLAERILACLAEVRPDVVLVTSPLELHPDHRALAYAVQRAMRRALIPGRTPRLPEIVAAYEVATPLRPNLLVAADATWNEKLRAVAQYPSQAEFHAYGDTANALGTLRALTLAGVSRAEAFNVIGARRLAAMTSRRWALRCALPEEA